MRTLLVVALALVAGPAMAHGGHDHSQPPGWTWDVWVTVPLALSLALFAVGWFRLAARSGHGLAALRRRGLLFASGWLILAAAVVSPLHEAGERSFTAHMIEHELMMLVAAPLLVASEPIAVMLWALPGNARKVVGGWGRRPVIALPWRIFADPVVATTLQAAALWLWHAPMLFDLALASDGWHVAQHVSFLVTALFFWTAMFHRRRSRGMAALCLFATTIIGGALGAFMAFSESPWYAGYAAMGLAPMGLTPAEDQQLAGLLMWIPGGLVHAGVALALVGSMLSSRETVDA